MRTYLSFFICISMFFAVKAQDSDAAKLAWDRAKTAMEEKKYQAAKADLQFVYSEMQRPLAAYYLGLVYDMELKLDSAVYYYEKSIKNNSKPMIQAITKLIRAELRRKNIDSAFGIALKAVNDYPDNKSLREELKSVCLWAFMTEKMQLDLAYLTNPNLQTSYKVNSVTAQYLILGNLRNEQDETMLVSQRQYKGDFEIWKCNWRNNKALQEIRFNLSDRDLDRALEAQHKEALAVFNNTENPLLLRIGAMLALLPVDDNTLDKILKDEEWALRLCACSELDKSASKKAKTACLKDKNELVQKAAATMEELAK